MLSLPDLPETNEQRHEKTCIRGFRTGQALAGVNSHIGWLET